jgi:tetratricopeptide (TPR) repeat protein
VVNIRITWLVAILLIAAPRLPAEDSPQDGAATNPAPPIALDSTSQVQQASAAPVQTAVATSNVTPVTVAPGETTGVQRAGLSEPDKASTPANFNPAAPVTEYPQRAVPADQRFIWLAMAVVLAISIGTLIFTWRPANRNPAAAAPPVRAETPATLVPNLLPVISQAIKEALMNELATQRRELLAAQQSAAAELAGLARRLEAVQTPLLERLGGPRPAAVAGTRFPREIPVKIFCACGQKYSFEVQPGEGRMPFPVACPACGQDGTHQANQVIARLLNGITQPLPSPNAPAMLNPAPSTITPQLVNAVKQAVVKELAPARADHPNVTPIPVVKESRNETAKPDLRAENFLASLLAEGQLLADAGELDKAAKCFDTALALQPDRAETLVKLGGVFEKQNRVDEALQQYDRAIALDESLTIAYLNKGGLFNRLARYDEALRCYEQALHRQKKSAA